MFVVGTLTSFFVPLRKTGTFINFARDIEHDKRPSAVEVKSAFGVARFACFVARQYMVRKIYVRTYQDARFARISSRIF
jgi:hypothetical protein